MDRIAFSWEMGSPFVLWVSKLMLRIARKHHGDPLEAMGRVWEGLSRHYREGELIDPDDPLLRRMIDRRMIDHYRQARDRAHKRLISLDELDASPNRRVVEPGLLSRERSPVQSFEDRDLATTIACEITKLKPPIREAVRSRLKMEGSPSVRDLAKLSRLTPKSVHQRANLALGHLRASLSPSVAWD